MLNIGKINTLNVVKKQGPDVYLDNGTSAKVLLADKKPPEKCQLGDALDVFVYVDSEGHLAATTKIPLAQVDDIAWLKVVSLNYVGAFLDWGLPKDLLVPFSEQHHEMEVGKAYLVKVFLDDKNRIAATTKIDRFIADESVDFEVGQKVSLIIADKTELGFKAIVNNTHWGLLYQNELFQPLKRGQKLDGYIKQIREDGKIDLNLNQPGYGKVVSLTDNILNKLKENNGTLMLSDKSPPEAIYSAFGVSKKVFKQAIGALYKKQLISIDKNGIKLV
ncbi:S1 RNA-binding domain-containing protein [Methylobacter sp. S3L5C]|uniref:CvfB family protein n=1 Tax=Methylobacter sp. S3L5C TaxID=2839024 RepID=UPI001FAD366D|nr:S1-like domain-containing RNA-binding protein [Methylobacter sp. S3L5C]UOA08508.1 GntR family transcriptional regulator [Methylobacter sp. S3L5C]